MNVQRQLRLEQDAKIADGNVSPHAFHLLRMAFEKDIQFLVRQQGKHVDFGLNGQGFSQFFADIDIFQAFNLTSYENEIVSGTAVYIIFQGINIHRILRFSYWMRRILLFVRFFSTKTTFIRLMSSLSLLIADIFLAQMCIIL